jgi:hypothetical protein
MIRFDTERETALTLSLLSAALTVALAAPALLLALLG